MSSALRSLTDSEADSYFSIIVVADQRAGALTRYCRPVCKSVPADDVRKWSASLLDAWRRSLSILDSGDTPIRPGMQLVRFPKNALTPNRFVSMCIVNLYCCIQANV